MVSGAIFLNASLPLSQAPVRRNLAKASVTSHQLEQIRAFLQLRIPYLHVLVDNGGETLHFVLSLEKPGEHGTPQLALLRLIANLQNLKILQTLKRS